MATLTDKGKRTLGILKKIKEYPEYKKHLPIISSGTDTFSGYIDFYLISDNNKTADMLFIQTISPLPGYIGNIDYMLAVVNPENISIVYNENYYDFDSTEIDPAETGGIDIGVFFRTILRIAEYGCLNWGLPFRRYTIKLKDSVYASGIKYLSCNENSVFSLQGDVFIRGNVRPIDKGTFSSQYDDIETFYTPLMYLDNIGGKLGIYPDELFDSHSDIIAKRGLALSPPRWLSIKEKRKNILLPYSFGQTVYYRDEENETVKLYISLINNNSSPLDDDLSWKEIDYRHPLDTTLLPSSVDNPLEELLSLFGKSFDLSTLAP